MQQQIIRWIKSKLVILEVEIYSEVTLQQICLGQTKRNKKDLAFFRDWQINLLQQWELIKQKHRLHNQTQGEHLDLPAPLEILSLQPQHHNRRALCFQEIVKLKLNHRQLSNSLHSAASLKIKITKAKAVYKVTLQLRIHLLYPSLLEDYMLMLPVLKINNQPLQELALQQTLLC